MPLKMNLSFHMDPIDTPIHMDPIETPKPFLMLTEQDESYA